MSWEYHPNVFENYSFPTLLKELSEVSAKSSSRYSVLLVQNSEMAEKYLGHYQSIPRYNFNRLDSVEHLKQELEAFSKTSFDYALAHIYLDGNSSIAWHNDKESLIEPIYSVSFGATRKFRLRKIGQTRGWEAEFKLAHGDVLQMKRGCQIHYQHSVPKELTVKEPRISFTFRKYDLLSLGAL